MLRDLALPCFQQGSFSRGGDITNFFFMLVFLATMWRNRERFLAKGPFKRLIKQSKQNML